MTNIFGIFIVRSQIFFCLKKKIEREKKKEKVNKNAWKEIIFISLLLFLEARYFLFHKKKRG